MEEQQRAARSDRVLMVLAALFPGYAVVSRWVLHDQVGAWWVVGFALLVGVAFWRMHRRSGDRLNLPGRLAFGAFYGVVVTGIMSAVYPVIGVERPAPDLAAGALIGLGLAAFNEWLDRAPR